MELEEGRDVCVRACAFPGDSRRRSLHPQEAGAGLGLHADLRGAGLETKQYPLLDDTENDRALPPPPHPPPSVNCNVLESHS